MLVDLLIILDDNNLNYSNVKELTNETKLFEDLQFDSLDDLEFKMGIEDYFNLEDIDDDIKFETIGEIIKYIEEHI